VNTQLETDRLLLRRFRKSDLDDLAALNGDEESMRFVSAPLTREQVAGVIDWFTAEWRRLGYGWFAVVEKQTRRLIGQCGLQCVEGRAAACEAELAFVIDKSAWGKGYATEAARQVITYGFGPGGLERIVAVTMAVNAPSQRVLGKLGFRHADSDWIDGHELMYFEVTKEDWMAAPGTTGR
jgi:RimJ/RimL family protein N-acetyltransferase